MDIIRKLIRKTRIDLKISQLDLVDGISGLSQSNLSRFEKGRLILDQIHIDAILDRLKINHNKIPGLIQEMERQEQVSFFSLRSLESMIRKGIYNKEKFKELEGFIGNPAAIYYARGKQNFMKSELDKAKKNYLKVVNTNEDDQFLNENLVAGSYLNLSAIAYKQNDLPLAFQYVDSGLEHLDEQGERRYLKYSLIYNKSFFYFILSDLEKAEDTLEEAWKNRMHINDDMRTRIRVYVLKASIKWARKLQGEAIKILSKAVDLAAINDLTDLSFELSVDLAKYCFEVGEYQLSESCFRSAMLFKSDLKNPNDASVHTEIAKLHLTMKRYRQAEIEIKRAIFVSRKHNDMYKLIKALIVKGEIETRIGSTSYLQSNFIKALSLSREYGFRQLELEILSCLVELDPIPDHKNEFAIQKDILEKELRGGKTQ
jgi:tetratricopeptide (TPR) repeat protein